MLEVNTRYCRICGTELIVGQNWTQKRKDHKMYICSSCELEEGRNRHMRVDGKYISKHHPLHKPGNYKSFGEAAFTALQKDAQVKEGYVYAICNPAWPDWVKIGMAIDAQDRLKGYQTSSPMRDYVLVYDVYFKDRLEAERKAHKVAERYGERQGEWFKITREQAILVLAEADLNINGG